MRRTVKALVAVVTCLSVHTHALQDLQLPHIELPQGCFDVLPGSPPPGWTGNGDWNANSLTFTDWEVVGSEISLSPSQLSKISVVQSLLVATVTFQVPTSCDGNKTLTVGLGESAWVHLHPSPGTFKLTCGASGVDHLLFQPAPVAGLVLQSIQLCPATGPSHWRPEGIPEPSCHGHGCGEHHIIMAESYYEETTESGCDTCHKADHPSGASMAPPKGTKAPKGTPAPPSTRGTKTHKRTLAPPSTQVWPSTAAPTTTTQVWATTAAPTTTTQVWTTSAAPATTTQEPTTAAPATTTQEPTTGAPTTTTQGWATTAAPTTTTQEPITAAPTTTMQEPTTAAPTITTQGGSTTAAPTTTTQEPTTAAPTTTTQVWATTAAPTTTTQVWATTAAPATTTQEPTTAAPTSGTLSPNATPTTTSAPTTTTAAPTTTTAGYQTYVISGCEVQSADPVISCVAPLTITSASLKFGRYDDSTCPDATVSSLTPYSSITVSLTPAIEQSSYTLDTTSGGLNALVTSLGSSDPDTGVYKQYQLTYTCGTAAPTTTTSAAPVPTLSPCTTIVYAYIGATYHCSPSVPMAGGLLSPGAGFITSFAFSAYLPGTVVQAYVYQWEFGNPAGQPTGSPLYTSAQVTGTDSPTSGVSQYSFSSMIPTTSGTQYVLYLQYVSGSEGSVGLSTPYDKQPSTAGAVSYYTQYSLWLGDAQFGIALTYTFCSTLTPGTA